MSTEDKILEKFRQLVEEGRNILLSLGWNGHQFKSSFPKHEDYLRFRTEALNLIARACGKDSDHYQELRRLAESKESATNSYHFPECLGVVEAALRDFEGGFLFDLRSLVAAELLGDFLEQTEYLLSKGYHNPAASLAGAVLEDTLRKLCQKHGLPCPAKTKIDRLNMDLAKAQVYNLLTQKRITAFADIRNNADHGRFDEFNGEDDEDMVKSIGRFAADHLE